MRFFFRFVFVIRHRNKGKFQILTSYLSMNSDERSRTALLTTRAYNILLTGHFSLRLNKIHIVDEIDALKIIYYIFGYNNIIPRTKLIRFQPNVYVLTRWCRSVQALTFFRIFSIEMKVFPSTNCCDGTIEITVINFSIDYG